MRKNNGAYWWRAPDLRPKDNVLDGLLSHMVGNMMNEIIFGVSYERDDPLWLHMQHLRETGRLLRFL